MCCDEQLDARGSCVFCDATLSSPPHVCLRSLTVISDEHGCAPAFEALAHDHETEWRVIQPGS